MPSDIKRSRRCPRLAFTVTELIVGCGLLATLGGIIGPLSLAAQRMTRQAALTNQIQDELANQLERLVVVSVSDMGDALNEVTLSPALQQALPEAVLNATRLQGDDGDRIEMTFVPPADSNLGTMTLTGWIVPTGAPTP